VCPTVLCCQRDSKEALRVLSELRTVIAVRAKDTQERERCALLRQNPDYKFEETESAESVMSRTINNIGLASEEYHVPVAGADTSGLVYPADPCLDDESETVQCGDLVTDNTAVECTASSYVLNQCDSVVDINEVSCFNAKHVALMAVAKSQQMVTMSEDTFGDDDCSTDSDG